MRNEQLIEQEKRIKERMANIKHKIIVMSGKGGVGKTTFAVNLAYSLSKSEKKVGLLDIDIHGPNVAKMLGIEGEKLYGSKEEIYPVKVEENLFVISIALVGYGEKPIIWRGPLKSGAIRQFLADVRWGVLDYLIIDSPPGTGDEPLTVAQTIPDISGAVIVATGQEVAIMDVRKSIEFAKELNINVIGVVENMSVLICPYCHKEINIFKKGGGEKMAEEMGVNFLGRIPFDPEVVNLSDKGKPFASVEENLPVSKAFSDIVKKIESDLK